MKKTYEMPTLEVLGTVESLTEYFGATNAPDTVMGTPLIGLGSTNGTVVSLH